MSDKKSAIDWASIRKEYEAGKQSIRAIAKWYKISDAAIRKQAKKHDWKVANQKQSSQVAPSANRPAEGEGRRREIEITAARSNDNLIPGDPPAPEPTP
jgi:predicted aspartyl protease